MKRVLVLMLAAALVAVMAGPAFAKWTKVGSTGSGRWFVSDKTFKIAGDCRTVLLLLWYNAPRQEKRGTVVAKKYLARICCQANTFEFYGVIFVSPRKKDFYSLKFPPSLRKVAPIKTGSIMQGVKAKVCSPDFGAGGK